MKRRRRYRNKHNDGLAEVRVVPITPVEIPARARWAEDMVDIRPELVLDGWRFLPQTPRDGILVHPDERAFLDAGSRWWLDPEGPNEASDTGVHFLATDDGGVAMRPGALVFVCPRCDAFHRVPGAWVRVDDLAKGLFG